MKSKCAWLLLFALFTFMAFGQFEDITNLRGASEGGTVQLTWELTPVDNPSAGYYWYELQKSADGTFEDVNTSSETFAMNEGNSWRESRAVGGLAANAWRFRIRVLKRDENPYPITGWSNIALVVVDESLQTPTLNIHNIGEIVSTQTVSMSIGGDSNASYDIHYGTNPNLIEEADFIDVGVARSLHTVQLAGVFNPDVRVYFLVRAESQGVERFSQIYTILFRPTQKFFYVVPHSANNEDHSTSIYIHYPGDSPSLIEFTALMGDSIFNSGSPQTVRTTFGAGSKLHFTTQELFGLPIHRKPIMIVSEQPIHIKAIYHSKLGSSTSVASINGISNAARNVVLPGLYGGGNISPGVSISNVGEAEAIVSCRFIWVDATNPDYHQETTILHSFLVGAFKSEVFNFHDVFNLPVDPYVGTLEIQASSPVVAVGAMAVSHEGFATIDFVQ